MSYLICGVVVVMYSSQVFLLLSYVNNHANYCRTVGRYKLSCVMTVLA